jgi:hypothetical protein
VQPSIEISFYFSCPKIEWKGEREKSRETKVVSLLNESSGSSFPLEFFFLSTENLKQTNRGDKQTRLREKKGAVKSSVQERKKAEREGGGGRGLQSRKKWEKRQLLFFSSAQYSLSEQVLSFGEWVGGPQAGEQQQKQQRRFLF